MSCPRDSELALYAGGELKGRRRTWTDGHVRECQPCAKKVGEFHVVRSAVASSAVTIPAGLRAGIRVSVLDRIALDDGGPASRNPLLAGILWACAPLALLAGVAAVWDLLTSEPEMPPLRMAGIAAEVPEGALLLSRQLNTVPPESPGRADSLDEAFGALDSGELIFVEAGEGPGVLAQLRIQTADASIEIHWLID